MRSGILNDDYVVALQGPGKDGFMLYMEMASGKRRFVSQTWGFADPGAYSNSASWDTAAWYSASPNATTSGGESSVNVEYANKKVDTLENLGIKTPLCHRIHGEMSLVNNISNASLLYQAFAPSRNSYSVHFRQLNEPFTILSGEQLQLIKTLPTHSFDVVTPAGDSVVTDTTTTIVNNHVENHATHYTEWFLTRAVTKHATVIQELELKNKVRAFICPTKVTVALAIEQSLGLIPNPVTKTYSSLPFNIMNQIIAELAIDGAFGTEIVIDTDGYWRPSTDTTFKTILLIDYENASTNIFGTDWSISTDAGFIRQPPNKSLSSSIGFNRSGDIDDNMTLFHGDFPQDFIV